MVGTMKNAFFRYRIFSIILSIFILLIKSAFSQGGYCGDNPYYSECECYHWKYTDCNTLKELPTDNPISMKFIYWPNFTPAAPHIAYYNYQLLKDYPEGDKKTLQFNKDNQNSLIDESRAEWSSTSDGYLPGLIWETTSEGSNFLWATDPELFIDYAFSGLAWTQDAVDDYPDLQKIKPKAQCNPGGIRLNNEILFHSAIFFNNTPEFWNNNYVHNYRWTTAKINESNPCRGTGYMCLDFKVIAIHELGHFVGIGHEGGLEYCVMFPGPYYQQYFHNDVPDKLCKCDIANFRVTYCRNPFLEVKDEWGKFNDVKIELFPNPSENIFIIKLFIPKTQKLQINILDTYGKKIVNLADRIFIEGIEEIKINSDEYYSGTYLINAKSGNKFYYKKLVIDH